MIILFSKYFEGKILTNDNSFVKFAKIFTLKKPTIWYLKCYVIVSCSSLTDPNNGMINCSLGDDGVPSYEDTCSFTCNIGYELTSSDIRTCQSDGSWSGSDDVCRRGNM